MTDWLEEYRRRAKNIGGLISNQCSRCSSVPYLNNKIESEAISGQALGTPARNHSVPGVPGEAGQEHREQPKAGVVFLQNTNDFTEITPGTPRTPPGDRARYASGNEALPGPTLEVLARLREHFTGRGFREAEIEAMALPALGELMRRKGGFVAMAGEVGPEKELAQAVNLARQIFGLEAEEE